MRKHLLQWMLLLVAFAVPWVTHAQVEVLIGDESVTTASQYVPAYNFFNYSISQQIYTADEIGMPGSIASIAFKNTGAEKTLTCNVYLSLTDKEEFTSTTDWVPMSADDLVFSGSVTFTANVWTTIELTEAFAFDGASNLLVTVTNVTGTYTSSPHIGCLTFPATNQALYNYRDTPGPYDIAAPGVTGTRPAFKNQIQLGIIPSGGDFCFKPSGANVLPTTTAATFSWNTAENALTYEWLYTAAGTTTADVDWTTATTTSGTSVDIENLDPMTSYVAYVRSNCGGEDNYSNATRVPFTTPCAATVVTESNPYLCDFEAENAIQCWEVMNGNVTVKNSGDGIHTGEKYLDFRGAVGNAIALPDFADGGTTGLQLKFWTRPESTSSSCGTFSVGYMTNILDPETYVELDSWNYNDFGSTVTYAKKEVSLLSMPAGARIVMKQINNATNYYWYVDDVEVSVLPSCLKPTNLVINPDDIDSNKVIVGWTPGRTTDDTWEVQYSTDGETWTSSQAINTHPYQIQGLQPKTDYQVRVRTICDPNDEVEGYSEWSQIISFRTGCGLYVIDENNSFTEDVSATSPTLECWNYAETEGTVYWQTYTGGYSGTCLRIQNGAAGNYCVLQSPTMQLIVPSRMTFFYKYNGTGNFSVWVSTDGGATRDQLPAVANAEDWTLRSLDLSAYTGSNVNLYFRFDMTGGSSDYCYLDELTVEQMPSCFEPSDLAVVSYTSADVTLSWVDNNPTAPTSWTVAYGPTATFELTDETTYDTYTAYAAEATVPNLDDYTPYSFAVRANCSPTDVSVWSQVATCTTSPDCGAMSPRTPMVGDAASTSTSYSYPFYTYYTSSSSYTYAASWTLFSADDLAGYDLYEGELRGLAINYMGTTPFSMPIQVYMANSEQTAYAYQSVSSDTIARADMTLVYDGTYEFVPGWNEIIFTTPFAYAGGGMVVCMARTALPTPYTASYYFQYTSAGSGNYRTIYRYGTTAAMTTGSNYAQIARTNMRFTMCVNEPSCLVPLNFAKGALTTTSVTLSWTNRSNAAAWELQVGEASIEITAEEVEMEGDEVSYVLNGLDPNTDYTVQLRSVCGETDMSEWTPTLSFHTLCESISEFPIFYGFETEEGFPTGTAIGSCPTTNTLGGCWQNETTVIASGGSLTGRLWAAGTDYKHTGSQSLRLPDKGSSSNGVTKTVLAFPPMQFSTTAENGYVISFWLYRPTSFTATTTNYEGFQVYLNNSAEIDANAIDMGFYSRYYNLPYPQEESAAGWYQYKITVRPQDISGTVFMIFEGHCYYGSSTFVDDIRIEEAPSCMPLTELGTGTPDANSVYLSWNEYDSDRPVQYLVEYTAAGAEHPDTARVNYSADMEVDGADNTIAYTLAGLTPNTVYTVRVAAVCTVGDTSEWTSVQSFRTACSGFDMPYTMNFEAEDVNSLTTLPWCWTRYNSMEETYPKVASGNANTGGRSLQYVVSPGGATAEVAILPQINDFATTTNRLMFYVKASAALDSALTVGIMTDPTDYTTFTEVAHIDATNSYVKHKITLPQGAGYVAIRGNRPESGANKTIYVDDVILEVQPGCEMPEGFARKGTASSTAVNLAWIDAEGSQWEIKRCHIETVEAQEEQEAEDVQVTETIIVNASDIVRGTVNPDSVYYTLTGLNARVAYGLRLRTVCDNDHSAWADDSLTFTSQNNETAITAVTLNGQYSVEIDAQHRTVTVTMPYGADLSAVGGSFTLSFGAHADTNGVTLTNFASTTDFSNPMSLTITAQDPAISQHWTIQVLNEVCARPLSLAVGNIEKYNLELSVLPNTESDNTNFQIVYSDEEMDAAALAAANPTDFEYTAEPYLVEHLNRNTTYYIYVRAKCGNDVYSEWISTTATTKDLGCTEDSPVVLVGEGTSSTTYGPICGFYGYERNAYIFTPDDFNTVTGTITSLAWNYSASQANTIPARIYLKHTNETAFTTTYTNYVWNTMIADATLVYDGTGAITAGWNEFVIDDFDYNGGNLMVLVASNRTGSGGASANAYYTAAGTNNHIYMRKDNSVDDNLSFDQASSKAVNNQRHNIKFQFCVATYACPAPAVTDVTLTGDGTNTANVTYEASAGDFANTYDIRVVATGATVPEDAEAAVYGQNNIAGTTTVIPVSGLSPYVEYDVYMRVHCDADGYDDGVSDWSEPYTFRTLSTCRIPQDVEAEVVSKTEVTFSWVNGSIENNEVLQDNNFQYAISTQQLDPTSESFGVDAQGIMGNADGTANAAIDNLQPGNTYYFYVANNCGLDGVSPYAVKIVEMPEPCVTPTNIVATEVGRYDATLTWDGDPYETEVTYELYYSDEEVAEEDLATLLPNVEDITAAQVTIDNLQRITTYYVYIRSICPDPYGASNWSEAFSFTTGGATTCDPYLVAEGESYSEVLPVYGYYYDYSQHSQSIYPAAMLTELQGKQISAMKYFVYSGGDDDSWNETPVTVKLMTTTSTSLASSFVSTTNATTVFTGMLTANETDGMTITFNQPFTYTGGNLLVDMSKGQGELYSDHCYFMGTEDGYSRLLYQYSDEDYDDNPDPLAGVFVPTVEFTYCSPFVACPTMEAPVASEITHNSAVLTWEESTADHVSSYELIINAGSPVTDFENANVIENLEGTTYNADGLESYTEYYVYLRTNCNVDNYEDGWSVWSEPLVFTTQSLCYRPSGLEAEAVTSNSFTLIWHRGSADVNAWSLYDGMNGNLDLTLNDVEIFGEDNDSVRYTVTYFDEGAQQADIYPNADYTVQVMSVCGSEFSPYAEQAAEIHTLNNAADFTAFSVSPNYPAGVQMGDAVIDADAATVTVTVRAGTDLTALPQLFATSTGVSRVEVAGEEVASGDAVDFTNPVVYTIYAEDEAVTKTWTVTVTPEACATAYGLTAEPQRVSATLSWVIGDVTVENFNLIVSDTIVTDFDAWVTEQNVQTITVAGEEMARSYEMTELERGDTLYVYLKNACTEDWAMAQYVRVITKNLGFTNCDADGPVVQVGEGTSNTSYAPFYTYFVRDGYTQTLYTASSITAASQTILTAGSISTIQFEFKGRSSADQDLNATNVTIYMANTDATSLTSGWVSDDLIEVFNGDVSFTAGTAHWESVELDTPFEWDGVSNILVAVHTPNMATDIANYDHYFLGTSATGAVRYANENVVLNDNNIPTVTGSTTTVRPNIKFNFCGEALACAAVTEAAVTELGSETATLTWNASDADYLAGYDIVLSETELNEEDLEQATPTFTATADATSYELENLVAYTNYYAYIRANCEFNEDHNDGTSEWVAVTFRTNSQCHTADNLEATMTDRNEAHITWTNDLNSAVQYVLSTTALDEAALAQAEMVDLEATDELDLTGLDYETPYFLYVRHNCGDDVVSPWQSTNFTTSPECPWIVNATAEPYFNAAVIDWTDGEFSPATTWHLVLTTLDENQEPVTAFDQVVNSHPYTVLGLTAETDYEVALYAVCGEVESEVYNDLSFTTPAMPGDCAQIGAGISAGNSAPIGTYYNYSFTEQLYTAEEIGSSGSIISLAFQYAHTADSSFPITVYMKHTDAANLSDGFVSIAATDQVFDGTLSATAGWVTIELDTPFEYDGSSNLLVAIHKDYVKWFSGSTWNYTAATGMTRYNNSDSSDPDPFNPGSGTLSNNRPNIQFCFVPSDCHEVRSLANSNVTANSADVSWLPGDSELQWNMVVSTTELDAEALAAAQPTLVTTVNQALTGLTVDADYYVYIQPICDADADLYGEWRMTHFVTAPTCSAPATAVAEPGDNETVTFTVTAGENGEPESYTYEYWVVGDEENVTTATTLTSEWTLTLVGGQSYGWRVRANCGETDGNSRWTDGNEFYLCGTIVVTEENPYIEDYSMPARLDCWTLGNNGLDPEDEDYALWYKAYLVNNNVYTDYFLLVDTTGTLAFANHGTATLTTPALQLPATGRAVLSFQEYVSDATTYQSKVYVLPNGAEEPVAIYAPAASEVQTGRVDHQVDISAFLGQTFRIAFAYEAEEGPNYGITNVSVEMIPAYTVTAQAAESDDERGQVAITAGETNADGDYYANAEVTVEATANEGYEFVNWTDVNGEVLSTDAEWSFYPASDTVLIANFDTLSYTLTVRVASTEAAYGSVTLDGVAPEEGSTSISTTAKYLTVHTIAAIAAENYAFNHWSDLTETDADYANATRTITMPNADLNIRAIFEYAAEVTEIELTENECDRYVLRRSDNSVVQTFTTTGDFEGLYLDPTEGQVHYTLHLTIRHSTNMGFHPEPVCDGYTWTRTDGTTEEITESANGTIYNYTNADNCPSTDTLFLTVNYTSESTVEAQTGCDSYRYTFSDQTQSTEVFTQSTEDATVVTTNAAGCDSTIHFALTIYASTQNTTSVTACDEYTWEVSGETYTELGDHTYQVVSTNADGCPHTEYLQLTLVSSEGAGQEYTETACDSLQWHGIWRTESGDYNYEYEIPGSTCTGTDVLHLTINQSTHTVAVADECDSYTWMRADGEEVTFTASAEEVFTYDNADGCPSADTLHLTIRHSTSARTNAVACNSYTWTRGDGTTAEFTESVTDELYSYTSEEGCASVDTLTLTVNQASHSTTIVDNACGSYTWPANNRTYNQSGTYYNNVTVAENCYIRDTLVLTVNPLGQFTDVVVACDSVEWHGAWYYADNNTATFTVEGGAANGCDSIVTLNLTVNASTSNTTTATACDEYTWTVNGVTYNTPGDNTYEYVTTNPDGCPNTEYLQLTIVSSGSSEETQTVCDSLLWRGIWRTVSDDYTYEFSIGECEGTDVLHLTVNPSYRIATTEAACDSYTWEGQTYTESTNDSRTFQSVNGCDSILTLSLTINPSYNLTDNVTTCTAYEWNGQTFTESTTETVTLTASTGCDSTVTLNLTITDVITEDVTVAACGEYTWEGQTYTESTVDSRTLQTAAGCDSIVTLHLTISDIISEDVTVTACGEYTWNGTTYTESTTDSRTFQSAAGCDSIVTLHLTISDVINNDVYVTACDDYTWEGQTYTESTTDSRTLQSAAGCDSIVTLHLTITDQITNDVTVAACGEYTWEGQTYTESTTDSRTLQSATGCDSIVTLHLTISDVITEDVTVTTCGEFTWNGQTYTESTTDSRTFTSAAGCDSIVTLHLTINDAITTDITETACDSYEWNGQTFTASTIETVTLTAANGCDSIVTLNLTINNSYSTVISETACDSYEWNGALYTESGEPSHVYTAANGCDSTVTLMLTINYGRYTHEAVTNCGAYTWDVNGRTYNQSGQKTASGTTAEGCPTRDTIDLTINQPSTGTITATACDSYEWNGALYTESGEPTHVYTAANGCDSTVTLMLTINHGRYTHEAVTNCGPYTWAVNGRTYNQSGQKTASGTTAEGCPTRDTIDLTINQPSSSTLTATACDSYTWNGQTYTETTVYNDTLVNAAGCDSIVSVNLTINYGRYTHEQVTNCGPYTWEVNGRTYNQSGMKTASGTTAEGCPTRDTIDLTINQPSTSTLTATACDSYTWNGQTYTQSTVYNDTLVNAAGCDSIVSVNLTINYGVYSNVSVANCGPYTWTVNGRTYNQSGVKTYSGTTAEGCPVRDTLTLTVFPTYNRSLNETACDSYTWNGTTYTESTVSIDTLQTVDGCDSIININLTINHGERNHEYVTNCGPYTWEVNGRTYNQSGEKTYSGTTPEGCPIRDTLTLTVLSVYNTNINETACDRYTWYGAVYTESGEPTHVLTAANGCDSIITLHLTINYSTESDVTLAIAASDLPYTYEGQTFEAFGQYDVVIANVAGCDSTIHLTLNDNQGIETADVLTLLKVYPNPTSGRVQLSAEQIDKVEVLDLVGRRVALFENTNTFDLSNLAAGTYTLRITMPEGTTLRKIVKR